MRVQSVSTEIYGRCILIKSEGLGLVTDILGCDTGLYNDIERDLGRRNQGCRACAGRDAADHVISLAATLQDGEKKPPSKNARLGLFPVPSRPSFSGSISPWAYLSNITVDVAKKGYHTYTIFGLNR